MHVAPAATMRNAVFAAWFQRDLITYRGPNIGTCRDSSR